MLDIMSVESVCAYHSGIHCRWVGGWVDGCRMEGWGEGLTCR